MALAAGTIWEVRSTGNANNGGGFVPGGAGTVDYSQADTPILSLTDLASPNSTTLTSVTGGFTALQVDNLIHITSGTNFTAGFYRIVTFTDTNTVILDRNPTTGAVASSGVGRVGGAVAALATIVAVVLAGNVIYLRGAFTTAATINPAVNGADARPISWIGYTTTRGDGGQATITSTNAAATSIINCQGDRNIFRNLTLDGASLSTWGFLIQDFSVTCENCWAKGCTQHGFRFIASAVDGQAVRCLATGNGVSGSHAGFLCQTDRVTFDRCVAHGNGGNGFASVFPTVHWIECISYGNTLSGFYLQDGISGARMLYCTSYGNTLDGLRLTSTDVMAAPNIRHNIFAGNAGYGIRSVTTDYSAVDAFKVHFESNAYWNNTLGARFQVPTGLTEIALTADPFRSVSTFDFGLNTNHGGGLLVRGLAQQFGLRSSPEVSLGMRDAGAVTMAAIAGVTSMRSLWREWTNERDTDVVPDATVDTYIDSGLIALNRRIGYHWTTSTGTTLVASTQEYALPDDCIEVLFVEHNGQELQKRSVEDWRRDGELWRTEAVGTPSEWAHYGNKLVLRPAPNAAAVAAASTLTIRYVSTPPSVTAFGPDQLAPQDWRSAVAFGVAEWSSAHPDSALAVGRAKAFMDQFNAEAALAGTRYGSREIRG